MGKTFTKGLFLALFSLFVIATASAQTITLGAIDPGPYGQGSTIAVPFNVNITAGCINTNNTFRLFLSDASGNFGTTPLATYNGFYGTFVNGTIPSGTPAGTGYRVKIVSTSPSVTSNISAPFTIGSGSGVIAGVASQSISPANPDVFGSCGGPSSSAYSFSATSTTGASTTASFFNEIAQATEGAPRAVPGSFSANPANYTITVRAVAGGVVGTKAYTLINNKVFATINNASNNTPCANGDPAVFPLTIQDADNNGFKFNYPGLTYRVTWGDGTSNTYRYCDFITQANSISHAFTRSSCGNNVGANKNVFRVELTPVNDYCNSSVLPGVVYIRVVTPARTDFTHPVAACLNSEVVFTNVSDPGQDPDNTAADCRNLDARYTWFVDGVPIIPGRTVSQPFRYTFTSTGTHIVKLVLQNGNGSCGVLEREYPICIQEPPRPDYNVPVTAGCVPLSVTPNNTSVIDNDCNNTNSFRWVVTGPSPVKYQGGTNAASETPQFLFDQPGVYTIKLAVRTASCGTDTAARVETIVVDGPPVAVLSPDRQICGINQTFTFNGDPGPTQSTVSGSARELPGNYTWTVTGGAFQFTGGTTANSRYPQILFTDAAAYTINVVTTSACGAPASDSQVITFQNAPVVDAGTSPPICQGSTVNLQGTVTNGTVDNVLWSGGGGTFSNATSLTTTYTPTAAEYAAGSVTLTLTGYTSLGPPCNQIPDNITITFQPPNAVTSADKAFTCSGAALGYNITALQPGSTFNWTVDPANTSPSITGYQPTGSGATIGDQLVNNDPNNSAIITYNITATNGTCVSDVFVLTVSVSPTQPVANFTKSAAEGCGNTNIQFTNISAPTEGSTYSWDFGDGGPKGVDANPLHLFMPNADGSDAIYNVILTLTSSCGTAISLPQTIIIRPVVPIANIDPPTLTGCTPVTLTVKNTSPGTHISYTFFLYKYTNISKTDSLPVQSITVTSKDPVNFDPISEAGNYTTFMRLKGYCNDAESVHIPIQIDERFFNASIFPTGPTEGCDGSFEAKIFNNSSQGPGYRYFYTIKNTSNNQPDTKIGQPGAFSYTFPEPGIYYITLDVTNACGKVTSDTLQYIVHGKPAPNFTVAGGAALCRESTVTFTNTTPPDATTQASNMAYVWDFGDGSPTFSGYTPPPHKYAGRLTPYTVTLTATIPATGCTNTAVKTDIITVTPPPGTYFTVRPDTIVNLPNYHFEFIDQTTGNPNTWEWNFGDGITSGSQNTNHTYADTGEYVVTLKVTDVRGCDSTFKQKVKITGTPGQLFVPNAFQPQGKTTELKTFIAKGSGIARWRLQVYNNWGQLLWQTTALSSKGEPTEGWDGTFKGVAAPQGTYIWQASAVFINGSEWKGMSYNGSLPKRSGYIHLIR
ncbi:PKD domain-containing protein [Mucilaginibacter terrigena]|uniref:PKD domain-containing protein n=1 Tax=Mucilaginibacter terrigena TaxID=2492395 RepID=A0A4Q5LRZ5_9SPHI|nr:PKD domain-containing protein [Mucilaginibacter terrigena]RYU92255.1 PKD domain-containing protein [Mucilaginibacter terrigena]